MHILCQLGLFGLFSLFFGTSSGCTRSADNSTYFGPEARQLAAQFPTPEAAKESLLVRARTAAVRLHTDATAEELPHLRQELEISVRALGTIENAAEFPWADWIEESRFTLPELAEQQLLAATHLLPAEESLALCTSCDFREMPAKIRIVAHQTFWQLEPNFAYARGRILLFRESTRARDLLRPMYVEKVLLPCNHPLVEELLLDIATEDSMSPRARNLAVRALGDRKSKDAPPILESLWDTEATNFLVRKEALLVILKLDPERGHHILLDKMPSREIEPGTWQFMKILRQQEGLPVPE